MIYLWSIYTIILYSNKITGGTSSSTVGTNGSSPSGGDNASTADSMRTFIVHSSASSSSLVDDSH
jgi:hypothetical protein